MKLMKICHLHLLIAFASLLWVCGVQCSWAAEEGFGSIFNGKNLAGWTLPEPTPF